MDMESQRLSTRPLLSPLLQPPQTVRSALLRLRGLLELVRIRHLVTPPAIDLFDRLLLSFSFSLFFEESSMEKGVLKCIEIVIYICIYTDTMCGSSWRDLFTISLSAFRAGMDLESTTVTVIFGQFARRMKTDV